MPCGCSSIPEPCIDCRKGSHFFLFTLGQRIEFSVGCFGCSVGAVLGLASTFTRSCIKRDEAGLPDQHLLYDLQLRTVYIKFFWSVKFKRLETRSTTETTLLGEEKKKLFLLSYFPVSGLLFCIGSSHG